MLIRQGCEASLPDVRLNKSVRVASVLSPFTKWTIPDWGKVRPSQYNNNNNNNNNNKITKAKICHSSDYFHLVNLCFSLNKWHNSVLLIQLLRVLCPPQKIKE